MASKTRAAEQNVGGLLDRWHVVHTTARYKPFETIFSQGDRCPAVLYIQKGRVKLTATSRVGETAVVGILGAGAFFGEGALAGQRRRRATAESMTGTTIGVVMLAEMRQHLHEGSALSNWFRSHLLTRNNQIEAALIALLRD